MRTDTSDEPRPDAHRWWIVAILTGLMFSLPFLAPFKAPPVPSFHAEALAAALGLAALCLTGWFRRGEGIPLPLTLVLPAGVGLLLLIQLLAGRLPAQQPALLALLYLLWAAGMIIVGAALRASLGLPSSVGWLAWFTLAGGALSALAGVTQLLGLQALALWVMPSGAAVWGNLGQPNHFAAYLAMALAAVLLLWNSGRLPALPALLLGLLMAWLLPLSGSRSVWLYAGSFAALALHWHRRARTAASARLAVACAALIPVMLLGEGLWQWLGTPDLTATTSLERLREVGSGERPHLWLLAWRMFTDSPWAGVGYGQYAWHYFLLNGIDSEPLHGYAHHAHNIALQLGAELGIPGVLALAAGLLCWWQAVRRLPASPSAWWLLCLCAVLGIHAMLEYPLWYAYFLGMAAVVLGLCGGRTLEFRPTRMLRGLLALSLALSWFVLAQLFRDYLYLENFLTFRYRYIDATAQVSERAKQMLLDIRRTSLLGPYVELGLARAIDINREQLDAKLLVNGHAMRQFPVDDVTYRHAMLLALKGRAGEARRQWEWARASYPDLEPMALAVLRRRAEDFGADLVTLRDHVESITRR